MDVHERKKLKKLKAAVSDSSEEEEGTFADHKSPLNLYIFSLDIQEIMLSLFKLTNFLSCILVYRNICMLCVFVCLCVCMHACIHTYVYVCSICVIVWIIVAAQSLRVPLPNRKAGVYCFVYNIEVRFYVIYTLWQKKGGISISSEIHTVCCA